MPIIEYLCLFGALHDLLGTLRLADILTLLSSLSNLGVSEELDVTMGLILIVYGFGFLKFC
jgi:hypothetical protein